MMVRFFVRKKWEIRRSGVNLSGKGDYRKKVMKVIDS